MTNQEKIDRFNKQIALIDNLKKGERFSPDFKKWYRDTQVLIERIFGANTRHIGDFNNITYTLSFYSNRTSDDKFRLAYLRGLENARAILQSFIKEIVDYHNEESDTPGQPDALSIVQKICDRFHVVVRQLHSRHDGRTTLDIEDEYDVQDLFHALLCLFFDDIRPEEYTPSYAGGSSRVDFLLKQEQVVIEMKKTRKGLGAKEIGEQLIIDIAKYRTHQDCKSLVCFVYDPEGRVANPRGVENDLTKSEDGFLVRVIMTPR